VHVRVNQLHEYRLHVHLDNRHARGFRVVGSAQIYRAGGYRFRVVASGEVAGEVRRHLRPFEQRDRDVAVDQLPTFRWEQVDGRFVASLDDRRLAADDRPAGPFHELMWRIGVEATGALDDRLSFHAGAVSVEGRGVMLPASSGSGKSTLVAALVADGAGYLSDEVAILDAGMLHPFPRPLGLKQRSFRLLGGLLERMPPATTDADLDQMAVCPDDIRPGAVADACPLDLVVFPRYEPGGTTTLEPISRAAGVIEAIGNSFTFQRSGGAALGALAAAARRARFVRLSTGDLADAVSAVRSALERAGSPS